MRREAQVGRIELRCKSHELLVSTNQEAESKNAWVWTRPGRVGESHDLQFEGFQRIIGIFLRLASLATFVSKVFKGFKKKLKFFGGIGGCSSIT